MIESDAPEGFWHHYFDGDTDYASIRQRVLQIPALVPACQFAGGIRVLRQDGWEALVCFILSQNNHIKRITGIVDRLCVGWGDPLERGLFSLPRPEVLASLTVEDLAPLRAGFRAKYLLDAARRVQSGEVVLEALPTLPLEEARAMLMKILGVGRKVADCALLFGFGRAECFPVDVWIARALAELLPEGIPSELAGCEGIAQQMIFHYMRACPDRKAETTG